MKALVYHGPWDVQIDDKPQPILSNIQKMQYCVSHQRLFVVLTLLMVNPGALTRAPSRYNLSTELS